MEHWEEDVILYSNQVFASLTAMQVHSRYIHLSQRPYKCEECEKTFIRSDDLKRHCRNHRNKELNKGKHMCSLCGKQFNNTGQRLRHERFSHMDIRNHPCEHCGKKFHTPQQLKRYCKITYSLFNTFHKLLGFCKFLFEGSR